MKRHQWGFTWGFAALVALSTLAQTSHAQGVLALRGFVASHPALSGDFVQTTQGKSGQQTGSFALAKPGMFRWALKKPFEQLMVSDGKTLTQWDADLNQATQRNAAGLLANTPLALLMGGAELDKFFVLKDAPKEAALEGGKELAKEPQDEAGLHWVMATPKTSDSQFKSIKLAFRGGLPVTMQIHDAFGGVSQLQFKNLSTLPLPAAQFGFTLPKGADVVKL